MSTYKFPIFNTLVLATVISVFHYAVTYFLLMVALGCALPPAAAAFQLLAFPLIISNPDLISNPVAWWLNSLGYGFLIAWLRCSAVWARHQKHVAWWEFRIGAGLIAFATVALLLGEIYHPVTGPTDARSEDIARRRAAAAIDTADNIRRRVAHFERVATDESWSPYVRGLNAKNAEEARQQAKQEDSRAISYRAEAEHFARLKVRPGTRCPALVMLIFGFLCELITLRQRGRSKVEPNENDVAPS